MTDPDRTLPDEPMSPAGRARRAEILGALEREQSRLARARVRRGRAALGVGFVGAAFAIGVALWPSGPGAPAPGQLVGSSAAPPEPAESATAPPASSPAPPGLRLEIVRTSTDRSERFVVRTGAGDRREPLSDEELLDGLRLAGVSTGLVRVGDRVWLTNPPAPPGVPGPGGAEPPAGPGAT